MFSHHQTPRRAKLVRRAIDPLVIDDIRERPE
jgi:hypothetical protein